MPGFRKQRKDEVPGTALAELVPTQRTENQPQLLSHPPPQENGAGQRGATARTPRAQGPQVLFGLFFPHLCPRRPACHIRTPSFWPQLTGFGVGAWSQPRYILEDLGPGTEQERVCETRSMPGTAGGGGSCHRERQGPKREHPYRSGELVPAQGSTDTLVSFIHSFIYTYSTCSS